MTDEDLMDIRFHPCPEGGMEVFFEWTEEGHAILVATAARAKLTPEAYLKRLLCRR